jgi:5-methylcytosine-specific restriction endonuclease McrA
VTTAAPPRGRASGPTWVRDDAGRVCPVCAASMEGKRRHAVYCSRTCKTRASGQRRLEDGRASERDRSRYEAEAEHRREYARAYHRARPEMVWEWRLQKRARRLGAPVYVVEYRDWLRLLDRYRGACAYCGQRTTMVCDHVIPLSRGGVHSIGNIVPACAPCNIAKRAKFVVEWRRAR